MAKILGGGVFGQMSGKLGSLVFARNRGGNYVRSFVKPIDPMTVAQLNARNNFGISASNYHSLDPTLKTAWKEFALNTFNPKTGTQGVPSGFNAYTALLNSTLFYKEPTSIVMKNPTTALTGTENIFGFSNVPPANQVQANFYSSSSVAIPFNLNNIGPLIIENVEDNYNLACVIDLNLQIGGITTPGNLSTFSDAVENDFGFFIYASNAVKQPGMFIQNPNLQLIATLPGLKTITTPAAAANILKLEFTNDLEAGNYHTLGQIGEYIQLTIFQVSTTGMMNRIGTQIVEIQS